MREHEQITTIFNETYPNLCRFLESLLGRDKQAQDIAQESFLRLYQTEFGQIPIFRSSLLVDGQVCRERFFTADFSQPVVEDLDNKRNITVVPENEIQSVIADGEIFDFAKAAEKRFEKSLVINSAKFKLEAASGTVRTANGEIIVKLSR